MINLSDYKDKLDPAKYYNFELALASLKSNIVWWSRRLEHIDAKERKEASMELKRCEGLLLKMEHEVIKSAKG